MRVKLQPAYVLHRRPFRDSSLILDILSAEYGRITLVAKGTRRKQRGGSIGSLLQPFVPLLLSFSGRSEMKNLNAAEVSGTANTLRGKCLFSGLYLNELLVRLLHRDDPHPALFLSYSEAIQSLVKNEQIDELLRRFELTLLRELGFGFDLNVEGVSGDAVVEGNWYYFDAENGLVQSNVAMNAVHPVFPGEDLLEMASGEFGDSVKSTAKRLLRVALAHQLGDKPLKSRDLFAPAIRPLSQGEDH